MSLAVAGLGILAFLAFLLSGDNRGARPIRNVVNKSFCYSCYHSTVFSHYGDGRGHFSCEILIRNLIHHIT